MASVRSLDNALEVDNIGTKITSDTGITQIPDNGRILRNLIHGADSVMSHITHFYQLSALDFVDVSALGAPFAPTYVGQSSTVGPTAMIPYTYVMWNGQPVVNNYVEALAMRRKCHTMSAIFSGRHPIQNAIVPGGVTTLPTQTDVTQFSFLLDQVRNFINTAYIHDVCTVANAYSAYWGVGTQPGNMLSYGEYPVQTGTAPESLLFSRACVNYNAGAYTVPVLGANIPTAFLGNVREYIGSSYYELGSLGENDGLQPSVGKTVPAVSKVNNGTQYSWLKAPRFASRVCEVGPLSRLVASYATTASNTTVASGATGVTSGFPVSAAGLPAGTYTLTGLIVAGLGLSGGTVSSLVSVLGRHACRALECKFLADAMADTGIAKATGNAWLTELRAGTGAESSGTVFTNLTNPVYVYAKLPTKPKMGAGWAEAPRGALGHWITIENKKIANYQCVVPSTWNHSPRDTSGNLGAAEQVVRYGLGALGALPGFTLDDVMITLIRVLHTYDFCIACAVHVVKSDGSTVAKFKMDTDGRITKLPVDAEI